MLPRRHILLRPWLLLALPRRNFCWIGCDASPLLSRGFLWRDFSRHAEPARVPWMQERSTLCCAVCNAVTRTTHSLVDYTSILSLAGMDIDHIICGDCRTLLMFTRNAPSVICSCCDRLNLVRPVSRIAHVNCGQCQTVLMYPYGAPSVKCSICNFITDTGMNTMRPLQPTVPTTLNETPYTIPPISDPTVQPRNVTVVVENPMTVNEKGKLVSNTVVGVITGGKK
ncbi:hypothetical protein GUJ93_ZPchr0009g1145 [Zizania palustris]|uniref:Zinc finger LSD1-type domain-containing protein n=1 Tax=Zizania palustris TaxID=103762 RepID=A0A8J5V2V5_ZIZPA|nr:hypothetical protein GUJ93_ZPchr0009g1145 [Zizania palustris]